MYFSPLVYIDSVTLKFLCICITFRGLGFHGIIFSTSAYISRFVPEAPLNPGLLGTCLVRVMDNTASHTNAHTELSSLMVTWELYLRYINLNGCMPEPRLFCLFLVIKSVSSLFCYVNSHLMLACATQ